MHPICDSLCHSSWETRMQMVRLAFVAL